MSKIFYDHLIIIEEVHDTLIALKLPDNDHKQLLQVIDETVHHHMLDVILTNLPRKHHDAFLSKLIKEPHNEKILIFLTENSRIDIIKEIQKTGEKIKKELLQLITQHHK